MPRLILFAPCENLIISQDNKVSIISLLENITIGLPANQPIPPNATLPMRWFALAVWEKELTDEGRTFESYIEAGHVQSIPARFQMTTALHRVAAQIIGFPLRIGGIRLRAFLREVGANQWASVGEYPLTVQQLPADAVPGAPAGPVH
jgi:hypothetical protein